jgi:acyl-coenzyme A synthetase/AMP-(fatty) acid ligase/lauroyl/myristoyl acyltransferase/acyl carrier protein
MLHSANTPPIPFTESEIEGSIYQRFQLVARRVPDQIAVNTLVNSLTYGQLDELSGRVAAAVASHPLSKDNSLVAILLDEAHLVMAAIFGILRTGRSVVALPQGSPAEQLRFLWQDTYKPLVITGYKLLELTRQVVSQPDGYLCMEDLASMDVPDSDRGALSDSRGGDLAMISYTSGSTGFSKGVMQSHRIILQTAFQNQTSYNLTPDDRSVVLASLGYGAGKTQCFAALLSGATLYLPNLRESHVHALVESLSSEQITILAMPPTGMFRQIMDELSNGNKLTSVRLAILGGDDLYQGDVDRFFSIFNADTTLVFRMAGTEMLLLREIHVHPGMKFPSGKVPIGYAVPEKEIFLLDEQGKEVPSGEIGEMVVRSRYLATGYWRQPELTAERFKPDPEGSDKRIYYTGDLARINALGQMEHLGRKDNMVKVHGFSVHLETVDLALCRLLYVKEGASAAVPLPGGDRRLVAYLVPAGGEKPTVGEIRNELAQLLPEHMQPSAFVWLEQLPRTSTGKVDRKAFPPAPRERPNLGEKYLAPRDEVEGSLVEIWKRLLQLDEIGVEDNFFDLGGDSLSSVRMIVEAEKVLGFTTPKSYFQKPTIANLVELFKEWKSSESAEPVQGPLKGSRVFTGAPGKRVTKYQAAVRKIMHRQWTPGDILRRLTWFGSSIRLSFNDRLIRKRILSRPYGEGMKELSSWVQNPMAMKVLYREQYRLFSQILKELDGCTIAPEDGFQASLMGNIFSRVALQPYQEEAGHNILQLLGQSAHPFRVSLSQLVADTPLDKLDSLFPVSNLQYLEEAYQAGKGVILLTYHSPVNRLAVPALSLRFKLQMIPTISEKRARLESGHWQDNYARDLPERELAALKAGVALEGQHMLEQGRIVQFASDNEYARQGYPVIIARRRYFLRPGFAELALNTGAAVVPQYNCMRSDGRIQMTVLPPFMVGSGARETQVAHLLDQYAAFINASWSSSPESIRWSRIFRHFDQPLF